MSISSNLSVIFEFPNNLHVLLRRFGKYLDRSRDSGVVGWYETSFWDDKWLNMSSRPKGNVLLG